MKPPRQLKPPKQLKPWYDDVADWYEHEFLGRQRSDADTSEFADRLGIDEALVHLLGLGTGICLEIGCGTGIYAERVSELGRQPLGVDISAAMLRHATGRLPIAQGDAGALPFASASVPAGGVVIKPGYLDQSWTKRSWTDQGLRDKVGANHMPLASLLNMVSEAGFHLREFKEGAVPTPIVLSFRATKDQQQHPSRKY